MGLVVRSSTVSFGFLRDPLRGPALPAAPGLHDAESSIAIKPAALYNRIETRTSIYRQGSARAGTPDYVIYLLSACTLGSIPSALPAEPVQSIKHCQPCECGWLPCVWRQLVLVPAACIAGGSGCGAASTCPRSRAARRALLRIPRLPRRRAVARHVPLLAAVEARRVAGRARLRLPLLARHRAGVAPVPGLAALVALAGPLPAGCRASHALGESARAAASKLGDPDDAWSQQRLLQEVPVRKDLHHTELSAAMHHSYSSIGFEK